MNPLTFADDPGDAIPLTLVSAADLNAWLDEAPAQIAAYTKAAEFAARSGEVLIVREGSGAIVHALVGLGSSLDQARSRFVGGGARPSLPDATYRLQASDRIDVEEFALGWLLAGYRFTRYRAAAVPKSALVAPDGVDRARVEAIAAGEALTRDLINTPASDMGPDDLEAAARALSEEFGAEFDCIEGDALLAQNLPMIHAVGRASSRAPRLIDMRWGSSGPKLTLVGKGVCFDTGGLNLKPGASMGLMKKDMGGSATVLGLCRMIMATNTDVQLRVLVPAVENAVAGDAFRPQDVLTSRKGLTVEVNNTDAEGRLVLADALALADEEETDLIVSMATLTGAARVALGADIVPFYTDDEGLAASLSSAGKAVQDPVWRMPFWDPYETLIEPGIADLDNAPAGGMAGSITAALFLRRFVDRARYLHFDIYGWQRTPAPARPKGGIGQGARALFQALPDVLG